MTQEIKQKTMSMPKAIKILKRHIQYRKGEDVKFVTPYKLNIAIETILKKYENEKDVTKR